MASSSNETLREERRAELSQAARSCYQHIIDLSSSLHSLSEQVDRELFEMLFERSKTNKTMMWASCAQELMDDSPYSEDQVITLVYQLNDIGTIWNNIKSQYMLLHNIINIFNALGDEAINHID